MSWSMRRTDRPPSTSARIRPPRVWLSSVSSPAAGSSMHSTLGLAASARATPTSLRWPCERSVGNTSAESARSSDSRITISSDTSSLRGRNRSRRKPRTSTRSDATCRFSMTVRSSNSSELCHVRPSPVRARMVDDSPLMSVPSNRTDPWAGTNPVMASIVVVLPAPLGPMRPTSDPALTSRSKLSTARLPPKETLSPLVVSIPIRPPPRPAPSRRRNC